MSSALCDEYRVVCPDIAGRGKSDWLRSPQSYQIPQYVGDMVSLLARLDANTVDFFGTSMGGLIGLILASLPGNSIRKLILNDVGPELNASAISRIGEYIAQDVRFDTFGQAAAYIRAISLSFGPHSEEQWDKLASDVLTQNKEGQWIRHYDLALAEPVIATTPDMAISAQKMLWNAYDTITCPTLLIRGSHSDLLTTQVAQQMTQRGPRARLVEIEGVGHAPTFVHADQIAIAREFLLA
jgi:pimeloyl-ACP methyl ester carboxylesterase